jgi:hypothetical protein
MLHWSNVEGFFHYPNCKIFKLLRMYVLLVLRVFGILKLSLLMHHTDIATSDFVPNNGGSIFFSWPEAGLTNWVHIWHSIT